MSNDVYCLASMTDPMYEPVKEVPELCKCEACGDYSPLSATLVIDNEFGYCLRCVKRGRLTSHVLKDYPSDRIIPVLSDIKKFLIANL